MSSDKQDPPSPQPALPVLNSPTNSPGPIADTVDHAHHIHEFGEVEKLVHIDGPARPSHDDVLPAPPISRKDKLALKERVDRLRRKCFHQRHIHQYWQAETLYRTAGNRSIGPDELFLDLVIVGGIAALGHELRVEFSGWRDVEKFLLLYAAIYRSWTSVVFLWNLWGVASDLTDKIAIYVVFTSLTFIALGAHGAFNYDGVRPYVAVASFVAIVIPGLANLLWGLKEPLIKSPGRRPSQVTFMSILMIVSALPYLAAAFVSTDSAARVLFWVAFGTGALALLSGSVYAALFVDTNKMARVAVNIELMVEKYDVLTMIVLGESVLGILFEGAELVTAKGVRLAYLFGAAAMGTSMLYCLQTLYNNVDAPIAKGGKHAIRYRKNNGLLWMYLHLPYHASLILFATGLGISLRDIAVPPTKDASSGEADHAITSVVRSVASSAADVLTETTTRASGSELGGFDRKARWLFSAGWGAALILSGLIGSLHLKGPRAATKTWRYLTRCLIALPIMFGMPYADVDAMGFLAVFTTVLVVIAVVEYVFVHMDKMGFFRSEATLYSSSTDALDKEAITFGDERDDDDDDDDSDDAIDEDALKRQKTRAEEQGATDDIEQQQELPGVSSECHNEHAQSVLRARLCKSHKKRLVAASKRKCQRDMNSAGL